VMCSRRPVINLAADFTVVVDYSMLLPVDG